MTTRTPEQIASDAYWAAGEFPETPRALRALMAAAVKADRAQRNHWILSFEPDAIRDHFEADEDDPTVSMTDEQLLTVGSDALQDDRLYNVFHELLREGLGA